MERTLYEMQAELCKTLSNPKRLEILDILKDRNEISVNDLAEILEIPKANTSQHLAVLRQSGRRPRGRRRGAWRGGRDRRGARPLCGVRERGRRRVCRGF